MDVTEGMFLQLVRLGIGTTTKVSLSKQVDWNQLEILADQQGLYAILLDGIEHLPEELRPPQDLLLEWIGEVLQMESEYVAQQMGAIKMSNLFQKSHIRTYILKGLVIAECYLKPEHRLSVDMDCFLLPDKGGFDAWSLGNDLIKNQGYEVAYDYYKNTTFYLPELTVENHQYMVPFRGNRSLRNLEIILQGLMKNDKGSDIVEGTSLCRPPIMVSAIFLIEHAYSHFLHQGLTWRLVLDWMMFSQKHKKDILWADFEVLINEYGFCKFYNSYMRLGKYLLGEIDEDDLNKVDKKMLADIWAPLDVHENIAGVKGKIAMAGNYWRARWKYKCFTDISWVHALWIQTWGHIFIKNPKL